MAGRIALPFLSPYVSTKFALEGFSDSLRREMKPFGIKTTLIEAGGIATPIWNKSRNQDTSYVHPKYAKSLDAFNIKFVEAGNRGMNVEKASGKIFNIIRKKKPKDRYIVASSSIMSYLEICIPRRIVDRIVIRLFNMDYGKIKG